MPAKDFRPLPAIVMSLLVLGAGVAGLLLDDDLGDRGPRVIGWPAYVNYVGLVLAGLMLLVVVLLEVRKRKR